MQLTGVHVHCWLVSMERSLPEGMQHSFMKLTVFLCDFTNLGKQLLQLTPQFYKSGPYFLNSQVFSVVGRSS